MRKSLVSRVCVLVVAAAVLVVGCSAAGEIAVSPTTTDVVESSAEPVAGTDGDSVGVPTTVGVVDPGSDDRSWATRLVAEVDPLTLEQIGPGIPAGYWAESAVVTDDVVAFVTWDEDEVERPEPRWRLVVADRNTGETLTDQRVGDTNVLGMFASPSGEVLVVGPVRSNDWNFADGFTLRSFDPVTRVLEEIARFEDGELNPFAMSVLGDGLIGVSGWERNNDGLFDRLRIVVYDWIEQRPIADVVLDDLPLEGDAPDTAFAGYLGHAVMWDTARSRAIVVHAHEDAVTTIAYPSGDVRRVELVDSQSLLGALFSWLIPPAYAKGLPSSQRTAVISGDRMHIAGEAATYTETDDRLAYSYSPTGIISVDLESLKVVNRSEAPIGFVTGAPSGGYLLGGGRFESGHIGTYINTDEQSTSGLLVIDPKTLEIIETHDLDVWLPQDLQPASSGDAIYIDGGPRAILRFDPNSGTITEIEVTTPFEAALLAQSLRYTRNSN